jgi:hypothetical protein
MKRFLVLFLFVALLITLANQVAKAQDDKNPYADTGEEAQESTETTEGALEFKVYGSVEGTHPYTIPSDLPPQPTTDPVLEGYTYTTTQRDYRGVTAEKLEAEGYVRRRILKTAWVLMKNRLPQFKEYGGWGWVPLAAGEAVWFKGEVPYYWAVCNNPMPVIAVPKKRVAATRPQPKTVPFQQQHQQVTVICNECPKAAPAPAPIVETRTVFVRCPQVDVIDTSATKRERLLGGKGGAVASAGLGAILGGIGGGGIGAGISAGVSVIGQRVEQAVNPSHDKAIIRVRWFNNDGNVRRTEEGPLKRGEQITIADETQPVTLSWKGAKIHKFVEGCIDSNEGTHTTLNIAAIRIDRNNEEEVPRKTPTIPTNPNPPRLTSNSSLSQTAQSTIQTGNTNPGWTTVKNMANQATGKVVQTLQGRR